MESGDGILLDAATIERIANVCRSYKEQRNARVTTFNAVGPSAMAFANFCNDQAQVLHIAMGKPDESTVRELYRRVLRSECPLRTPDENVAFRELLGCIIGLFEVSRMQKSGNQ